MYCSRTPMKTNVSENGLQDAQKIERLAYSGEEIQRALGISHVTLWRLEKRGLLRPLPGLKRKLYAVAEVQRFVGGKARGA